MKKLHVPRPKGPQPIEKIEDCRLKKTPVAVDKPQGSYR